MYQKLKQMKYSVSEDILNKSFNKNKVNDPAQCGFASSVVALEFFHSGLKFTEESFFNFHNDWLIKNCNKDLSTFFRERLNSWKDITLKDTSKAKFIFNVFITRTFNGILKEYLFMNNIRHQVDFIRHSTIKEDVQSHFDFYIEKNGVFMYIQLKPKSFYHGLNKSYIQDALKKMKGIENLFIITYNKNIYEVLIRDKKNNNNVIMVPLKTFLSFNFTQNQVKKLSIDTWNSM